MIKILNSCDLRLLLKDLIEKTGSWEGIEKSQIAVKYSINHLAFYYRASLGY
jgi:hypothetical protein